MRTINAVMAGVVAGLVAPIERLGAEQVSLAASKDNTLYEQAAGTQSDGAGEFLFAGKTGTGQTRRAVIAFDVASSIPAGSTIVAVTLKLNMSRTGAPSESIALHRVLGDWGEGTSNAGGNEGSGATSTVNDATWIHRFFNTVNWTNPGGDFDAAASATLSVGAIGSYTWASTTTLIADVQTWLDTPDDNFGWLLRGNESVAHTTKRFDSRQNTVAANRPALTVTFTTPEGVAKFRRGDANQDGAVDLSDAVCTLIFLFAGSSEPCSARVSACRDAADANDDGSVNIADCIAELGYLFGGGGSLPGPAGACWFDLTSDELSCTAYAAACP